MGLRIVSWSTLFLALAPALAQEVQQPPTTFALVGGAVLEGTGKAPLPKATVVVRADRIVAVGVDIAVPDGARVIDCAGKTVVPGLIDMHGHYYGNTGGKIQNLFEPYARLYLAGGVTTTFSPGDFDPEGMLLFRERVRRGETPGPRILTAGPYLDHHPSQVGWIKGVADAEGAEDLVRAWAPRIDGVKVYTSITEVELEAVIRMAHAAGLRVTGHLGSIATLRAIELGIDRLEHGIYAIKEFGEVGGAPFDLAAQQRLASLDLDGPVAKAVIDAIVKHHVVVDPTVVILQAQWSCLPPVTDEVARYLDKAVVDRWRRTDEMQARMTKRHGAAWTDAVAGAVRKAIEFAVRVHRAGGIVVAGTDPVAVRLLPGWGLHAELRNFVAGGMSPIEALRCGAYNAALALGREQELGTIEVGRLADLVVVDGDPATDLAALRNIALVVRAGTVFDPVELRRATEGAIR